MSDLKTIIAKLASDLAADVVAALRRMSLADLAGFGGTEPKPRLRRRASRPRKRAAASTKPWGNWGPRKTEGKRVRRSPAELEKIADQIVAVVKAHPKGINAEAIKTRMGIKHGNVGAKIFTKPLSVALASKKIRKTGERRATMYFGA